MIKFEGVSKKFLDGTIAVSDFNLEIGDGEFVFLVGPSGAGKTTLFRLLIRDYPPSSGKIFVDGQDIALMRGSKLVDLRRKIGVVFQDLKLISERTVFENVALSLEVLGKNRKEIALSVEEKLKLVGLWEHRDFFPVQLSGGEAQRAAIARAICGQSKYLLADEPTGNVDEANAWAILKILDKIGKSGTTVLMATHNSELVNSAQKRVVRIENGHLISDRKGRYR